MGTKYLPTQYSSLNIYNFNTKNHKIEKSSTVACLALNKLGISAPYHNFFPYGQLKVLKTCNHNT